MGAGATIFSGIVLYLGKAIIEMPGKYVLRNDCQRDAGKLHQENREDHQLLFNEIKDLKSEFAKSQTVILQELRKQ